MDNYTSKRVIGFNAAVTLKTGVDGEVGEFKLRLKEGDNSAIQLRTQNDCGNTVVLTINDDDGRRRSVTFYANDMERFLKLAWKQVKKSRKLHRVDAIEVDLSYDAG